MKHLLLFSLLFTFAWAFGQKELGAAQKPFLQFETIEIVRKDIPYDSKELFVFEFTNKSKKPATITNVQTSCGCTTAEKPENAIKKGKKGKISVSYDTKRVGDFVKTITVTSNVSIPIVLTIRGNVLPEKQP